LDDTVLVFKPQRYGLLNFVHDFFAYRPGFGVEGPHGYADYLLAETS